MDARLARREMPSAPARIWTQETDSISILYDHYSYTKNVSFFLSFFLYVYIYIYIYVCVCVCVCVLSTLVKEFSAAARIMQSFSNELSTLVSGKV